MLLLRRSPQSVLTLLNFDSAIAQRLPYGPDTCRQGYVWREAVPNDQTYWRSFLSSDNKSSRDVFATLVAHSSGFSLLERDY
ncbi:hypothetical protein LC653_12910 [Nostoc sp. CHAB 5784]|uniref:hypothetical protein n=1 Tax=Nostoc mirabile TaxID=2907820 RepID=UPI001E5860AF|nr:hypothetical protein [Nostoc mirabile]MCC5664794.1 hypothetical protein [Nostoc mirabile CHAB5784]